LAVSRDSARRLNDKGNEAAALHNLGVALREVRRFGEAISAHQAAAAIYRETGDRHREGNALNNLGTALQHVRRFEEAIATCCCTTRATSGRPRSRPPCRTPWTC
jgi:tetratricopeptide (TPR) repeat protein